MSDTLFPYYERELLFLRQSTQEFAKRYPATAGRLMLEPNRSGDPHIERLIQSFALIAGRIHRKLDDEFPELTESLLGILYPHYLAPVPSMGIVQFELDPTQAGLPNGFDIPRHSRVQTHPLGDLRCRFRTAYPTTLWPVRVTEVALQRPPFPPGLISPAKTAAAIRIQLECIGKLKFQELSLERLRLFLNGDNHVIANLYELIFNHAVEVVIRSLDPDGPEGCVSLSPDSALRPVGFDLEDGLLPYPKRSFPGYRLLTEFFAFPNKFHFVDIAGWSEVASRKLGRKVEVVIFLDRSIRALESEVDESTFRIGATPIVNLFEQIAEPIPLTQSRYEYRVTPDVQHPLGKEIYSIDSVVTTDLDSGKSIDFEPFYSPRRAGADDQAGGFWYASRRWSMVEDDRATDVHLTLVDRAFDPWLPAESTMVVRTTCTNRNLPNQLQRAGEDLYLELEAAAPTSAIHCLVSPTTPMRPPLRRGAHWALISHLSLNYLSLTDPDEGCESLKEILRLYDFSDPEAGQQQRSEVAQQLIEGIVSLSSRRVVGRTGATSASGFARGLEISVEFDEEKYVGTGTYLFASVLERFLGLYVSINSFSQLVARSQQREGIFKKWRPRAGEQQLI